MLNEIWPQVDRPQAPLLKKEIPFLQGKKKSQNLSTGKRQVNKGKNCIETQGKDFKQKNVLANSFSASGATRHGVCEHLYAHLSMSM